MSSDKSYLEFICDQTGGGLELSYRMMMGEYIIYLDGKVVALVCDNQLFMKPTDPGREILGTVTEAPPYPGAKNCFLIGDEIEDPELMRRLWQATADALPLPKKKKKKK